MKFKTGAKVSGNIFVVEGQSSNTSYTDKCRNSILGGHTNFKCDKSYPTCIADYGYCGTININRAYNMQ